MDAHRMTISAVLIVKDEEDVLARCLESVAWADEIVVYDTGSTDSTRQIARQFTDRVVEGYWDNDFGAARNRALEHATGDWVLSIDADEVLTSSPGALRKRLGRLPHGVYVVTVLNETVPLAAPEATTAPRVFSRVEHHWEGRLHEQVRRRDGSPGGSAALLSGVELRHTGYTVEAVVSHDKRDRNLQVVRSQLDDAVASGDRFAIGAARVHLVRSLAFAGRHDDAREAAELAWASVDSPRLKGQLALTLIEIEISAGRFDEAQSWVERWAEAEPGMPAATIALARIQGARGENEAALRTFRTLPVSTISYDGTRFDRWACADLETALLLTLGRDAEALDVVRSALRHGARIFRSAEVLGSFGEATFDALLDELNQRQWRDWCQQGVKTPTPHAVRVLELMDRHRPGDLAVLLCAARLHPLLTLEQAGEWSARLRRIGLSECCPLLAYATDDRRPARERALAAALLLSAYGDERALEPLERSLAAVPDDEQAALAVELEIVAPGLVQQT